MQSRTPVRLLLGVGALLGTLAACERQPAERPVVTAELISVKTLGLAYLEENELGKAAAEFTRMVELAPGEALGHANLGLVRLLMVEHAEAEAHTKQALSITPDDPDMRLMLAQIHRQSGREAKARETLQTTLKRHPGHIRTLYALAELAGAVDDQAGRQGQRGYLDRIVELAPANLAARLLLIDILLRQDEADLASTHMEEIRRQVAEFPIGAEPYYDEALRLMGASRAAEAIPPADVFHNLMRTTTLYSAGFRDLIWLGIAQTGFLTFSGDVPVAVPGPAAQPTLVRFADVTASVGLDVVPRQDVAPSEMLDAGARIAVADYDGDGDVDLQVASWAVGESEQTSYLFRNDPGTFVETAAEAGVSFRGRATSARFADYDNDGRLDLYIVLEGPNVLYRGLGEGKFLDVTDSAGVGDPGLGQADLFIDVDHDGDLDLYVLNAGVNRLYRNNADGTFVEFAETMGIAGNDVRSRDAALADFDDDGDIDLYVVNQDANDVLYTNLRQGSFQDISVKSGLSDGGPSGAVAVGDYDNDGSLDLFVGGLAAEGHRLYRNTGDGSFARDRRSTDLSTALQEVIGLDASFLDFDNDGFLDLVVVGQARGDDGRGVTLFHNDGTGVFRDVSSILPAGLASARQVEVADYGDDGDLDLFIAQPDGQVRLLRNDGGDVNHYLKVQLLGLVRGSSKNNHFGIGSKLEIRAGDSYQMRVVTDPASHFGLGPRPQADALRIVWTNGIPQNLLRPRSDQRLVEEQVLKGSCAFVYTWNGSEYVFVTDIMWRSAIGMPLGIMGASRAYAPPAASMEYLLISGDVLRPKDGVYSLQLTEELWEVAYIDEARLLVIDHPDSVDVYVDERFVPPGPASLQIHEVVHKRYPVSARDHLGNDLLSLLRDKDDVYVANLTPARYQGVTEPHDLILDLGELSRTDDVKLFLKGWIFPTDASINVAMSQSDQLSAVPPYLQVPGPDGEWHTVIENLSFPAGKNKTVVADLARKFLTDDYRVRIRTNMEIYWDQVFFSTDPPANSVRRTTLRPASADLHYRGFSREYRKGGRHGPHWFDYRDVSTEPRWLPITGRYTRFGEVLELLLESDDRYIVMGPGDETTVEFDAEAVPAIEPGWKRDFLLYTDGWIKDADINTARGNTVAPLPFHAMSRYPYGTDQTYPGDRAHRSYLEIYNTRAVTERRE